MKAIKIYGASDDIIEIDGAINEEFPYSGDEHHISVSDGTVLSIDYTNDGLWRVNRLAVGTAEYSKFEATDSSSRDYSDIVTLTGDIKWVCVGKMVKVK